MEYRHMMEEKYSPEVEFSDSTRKDQTDSQINMYDTPTVDPKRVRYPYCIVWTPIPMITWVQFVFIMV